MYIESLCTKIPHYDNTINHLTSDIQECENSTLHNCDLNNNVICRNLNGSFECTCVNSSYSQVESSRCSGKYGVFIVHDISMHIAVLRYVCYSFFVVCQLNIYIIQGTLAHLT